MNRPWDRALWGGGAALGLAAAVYMGWGFLDILTRAPSESDLYKRWLEESYAWRGISPFDAYADPSKLDRELGTIHSGSYPSWSLFTGLALVPPLPWSWYPINRVWFALLNAIALLLTARWVWGLARPHGTSAAFFLTMSALAIFCSSLTLHNTNYGVLLNALLIGVLVTERRSPRTCGLLYGLAALKPNYVGPFGLILLVRKRFTSIGVAVAYTIAAAAIVLLWTDTPPLLMLSQWYEQTGTFDDGDKGILGLLFLAGVPRSIATAGTLLVVLGLGTALMFRFRHRDPLTLAAIAAVMARLWAYHRRYDDSLLLFLLVPVGLLALRRPGPAPVAVFLFVGLTVWAPLPWTLTTPPVTMCKIAIWIIGVAYLLAREDPVTSDSSNTVKIPGGMEKATA